MAQKRITKSYDQEFKSQAVKRAQEIGGHKAATELGIPSGKIYTWIKAFKEGRLAAKDAAHNPNNALILNEELIERRKRVREQDKEIRRLKEELLYGRYDTSKMRVDEVKTLVWRYYISYWNNRRICSANGGLPPVIKRQQYYASLQDVA